jgi:hypothetical protein
VRLYIQGLPSFRVLARLLEPRLGHALSPFTLNKWVHDLGACAKTPIELSAELQPSWGGFLGVDGKAISIKGKEHRLLIGIDHPSHDVVHAEIAPSETTDAFVQLITEARLDAGYPLRGIVCDLARGFVGAHRDHFGSVPFQACRIHFDRRLDQEIPVARKTPHAALNAEVKDRIRAVLYAETYEQACELHFSLRRDKARYGRAAYVSLRGLDRNFNVFMAHHFTPGLPADNNVAENVIKQLSKKVRLMEGFQSVASAERVIRLLIGCYRFKRFTGSSRNGCNGRSPLELAGVELDGGDWLTRLLIH